MVGERRGRRTQSPPMAGLGAGRLEERPLVYTQGMY